VELPVYHIVFIPKYRRKVLYGQIKTDVREIIKKLCEYKMVVITLNLLSETSHGFIAE